MRYPLSVLLAPALLLLTPSVGAAQDATDRPVPAAAVAAVSPSVGAPAAAVSVATSAPTSTAAPAGPVAEAQSVALKARNTPAPAPRIPRDNTAQNRALMVVGAVGIVIGAVIGDDAGTIVMLGSAGIGLLGLYRWLN